MSEASSKLPANENPAADSDPDPDPESVPLKKRGIHNEISSYSELLQKIREEAPNGEVRDSVEENLEEDEVSMEEDDEESMEEDEEECSYRSFNWDREMEKRLLALAESESSPSDGEDDYDDDDDGAESKFRENDGEQIDKLYKNPKVEEPMVELNPKKSSDPQFNYEKLSLNKDDALTSLCVSWSENPNPAVGEIVLKSTMMVLKEKREILWSRICSTEDELALHEETFERLTRGEDHSKPHCEQQTRLHGTFFREKSSCEDLKDRCLRNGWRLPRYIVEPSNGRFLSTVFVSSEGINLTSKGDLGASPSEARESVAAKIINEIRKMKNTFARSIWG